MSSELDQGVRRHHRSVQPCNVLELPLTNAVLEHCIEPLFFLRTTYDLLHMKKLVHTQTPGGNSIWKGIEW